LLRSLGDELDTAIRAIAHDTQATKLFRHLLRPNAKEDALHATFNDEMQTPHKIFCSNGPVATGL